MSHASRYCLFGSHESSPRKEWNTVLYPFLPAFKVLPKTLNSDEKVRPFKSTAEEVSFERSHHRTLFTVSKVGSTFQLFGVKTLMRERHSPHTLQSKQCFNGSATGKAVIKYRTEFTLKNSFGIRTKLHFKKKHSGKYGKGTFEKREWSLKGGLMGTSLPHTSQLLSPFDSNCRDFKIKAA